jgi:SAM-dependent methyltransferase
MKVLCMHAAGLGELVAASLGADVDGRVVYADDSAVMITTKAPRGKVGGLSYVRNCFVVIGSVPRRRELAQAVQDIVSHIPRWSLPRTGRSYRLMFSLDGQLAGVPGGVRSRLESAVSRACGGRFTPRGGGDEYWTITRRDLSEVLFCERIARPRRREPPKGGLAPDIAELVVNTVRSCPTDVVLDPFAGSGALVAARIRKPFQEAICSDLGYADGSAQLLSGLAGRAGVRKLAEDARRLPSIPDDAVDVVLTDPPWGEFDQNDSTPQTVIAEALGSIRRVLRPGGQLAMLVSRRLAEQVEEQWRQIGFQPRRSYDLLVNGHPATVRVGALGRPGDSARRSPVDDQ